MVYEMPAPGQTQQTQKAGGAGGGGKKPEWDPRAGEKDFLMAAMNGYTTAVAVVQLEAQARAAAGGVSAEADILTRVHEVAAEVYEAIKARRADMVKPVPQSLAQQAPAAQAPPAAPPAAQPPAPTYPAPAPAYTPPVAAAPAVPQGTIYDGLPFFDHLVPFGKHATVNGVKGQPHLTIAELAAGVDPGWLHWAAVKAPAGKYTDGLTRAGNTGAVASFQERVIHFLNAAESAGKPVPKPEFNPNQ